MAKREPNPPLMIGDHKEAKRRFFEAAGIADTAPYAGDKTVKEAIKHVRINADISDEELAGALNVNKQRLYQLLNDAHIIHRPYAHRLGEAIKPLLQDRLEKGMVKAGSFERLLSRKEYQDNQQKEDIIKRVGIKDPSPYETCTAAGVLSLLRDNAELTNQQIASSDWDAAQVKHRFYGTTRPEESFLSHICPKLKTALEQGVKEGWIAPDTLWPKPIETIIAENTSLMPEKLQGATGASAMLTAAKYAGVPEYALGPLIGLPRSVACKWKTNQILYPSQAVTLARELAPYIAHEKQWSSNAPVISPGRQEEHRHLRHHFMLAVSGELKERGKRREAEAFLAAHGGEFADRYASLGELLVAVRESIPGLFRDAMGVGRHKYALYESNALPVAGYDADGELKQCVANDLCAIAEVVAGHWPETFSAQEEGKVRHAAAVARRTKPGRPGRS